MTRRRPAGAAPVAAALVAAALALGAAGCSSAPSGHPQVRVYRLLGRVFAAAFPSPPSLVTDPPAFTSIVGLPAGTRSQGLRVGQLGDTPELHSYEVIVAVLPASASSNVVAGWFRAFAEGLPVHVHRGVPIVEHVTVVKRPGGDRYGGFELVRQGHALFVVGAYDSTASAVTHFLTSFAVKP